MSSKRQTPEAAVVQFFMTADEFTAVTLLRVVRGIVDQRGFGRRGSAAASATPTPRPRRARADGAALLDVQTRVND